MQLKKSGLFFTDILVPAKHINLQTWAVIACDQFTQNAEYWQKVKDFVGTSPSTLNIILPEIELLQKQTNSTEKYIHTISSNIQNTMREYLQQKLFRTLSLSMVYVKRKLVNGKLRRGILAAIDLDQYDTRQDARIRATEAVIQNRMPIRIQIRKQAALETPHALLLYEDKDNAITNTLEEHIDTLEKIYETSLMFEGGSVTGFSIPHNHVVCKQIEKISSLVKNKFVIGDGNHSLLAAKKVWEEAKYHGISLSSPLRYCLVECINIYDEGLDIHPIHKVSTSPASEIITILGNARLHGFNATQMLTHIKNEKLEPNEIALISNKESGILFFPNTTALDALRKITISHKNVQIDSVHSVDIAAHFAKKHGGTALIFPSVKIENLFSPQNNVLPPKAFSLGSEHDKRYYIECRRLK